VLSNEVCAKGGISGLKKSETAQNKGVENKKECVVDSRITVMLLSI
jgi:hypothetical protein